MVSTKLLLPVFIFLVTILQAQTTSGLLSGPWAGNVELRNATIWAEVLPGVKSVAVKLKSATDNRAAKTVSYKGILGKEFNPVKIELNGLEMNTTYSYSLVVDGKEIAPGFPTKFTTKDLWQHRKPAPDFSFLAGSCAYFNEPVFDRPGKPYGGDSSIFEIMAATPAAFHLWLGDNWYTREADYFTPWGLNYRASRDRSLKVLQKFYASMPQYAIWDDHDFGPDNSNSSFIFKEESREVFSAYWLNPGFGEEGKGIYTKFSYSDVDFFLLDDRFFRSADDLPDSIDGLPNNKKRMYGEQQLLWLENALATSLATFKVIATGSQVLNPLSTSDCVRSFPADYQRLLDMIGLNKINGVLFFTGDRHHSEVMRLERTGNYTLYDVTASPYTSGIGKVRGVEINHPARERGTLVEEQNFARVDVSGNKGAREFKVSFVNIKGAVVATWSINESALKTPGTNK